MAYIAQRKLELADVKARTELDRQKIDEAVKAGVVVRDVQVKDTQGALASTREQLKQERQDNSVATNELRAANRAQGQELDKTAAQLDAEKQARLSAEGKLAGAMKDLAAVAAVKEEARGMVITLSGSVLFASGKFALLNTAMTKLDQVAEALKAQDADKRMVVEGHTDSQGSDRINQPLSLNRGNAVRDYLVSRGVASEKITAVGLGSPVQSSTTSRLKTAPTIGAWRSSSVRPDQRPLMSQAAGDIAARRRCAGRLEHPRESPNASPNTAARDAPTIAGSRQ